MFQRLKYISINAAFILAILAALIPGMSYLQFLEGKFYPVVKHVAAVDVKPFEHEEDDDRTAVVFTFQKVRDCEFLGIDWYKKTPRGLEKVRHSYLRGYSSDQDNTRPSGDNVSEPWIIYTRHDLMPQMIAEVQHRCHPYWITVTQFWP